MNRAFVWVLAGASFAIGAVVGYWILKLTVGDARKADLVPPDRVAEFVHAILEANRKNYTENVVEKLSRQGVAEAVEHWRDEKGVPLPAQFLLESGRLVAQKDLKFSFRLASLTPIYVWNGPTSDFERKALEAIAKDPDKPFTGYAKNQSGRFFQAVYADKAVAQSCVTCHNNHPNSPRRDYKLNDVMGGIVITIPVGS
jgi:hypothetical protein